MEFGNPKTSYHSDIIAIYIEVLLKYRIPENSKRKKYCILSSREKGEMKNNLRVSSVAERQVSGKLIALLFE